MADISIGDVVANLRLNATDFQRGLQDAIRALQQFAQTKDQIIQNMQRLQQSGQQAGQSFQQFNTQINQTNQQFTQTNQTLNQVNQTFMTTVNVLNEARQSAQNFSSTWSTVLQIAGGIGLATSVQAFVADLRGALERLVEFGRSVIEVGQQIQGLQLAFRGLAGSAQSGAADFAFITRESQRLGLGLLTAATTFRNFEAAAKGTALEGQQARDIFKAVAQAARVLGVQGNDLQRVFQAVDRMMQTQVINARELRLQLGTALPGSIEILARSLGVTTQQLFEMTKQGSLLATEALPALARGLREELGANVSEVGNLASTAFARLNNELVLLKTNIAESGLLQYVRDVTQAVATLLEQQRKAAEAREREAAAPGVTIPTAIAGMSPALEARQREIVRLQEQLREEQTKSLVEQVLPGFGGGGLTSQQRAAIREQLLAVQEEQRKAIAEFQRRLQAEGGAGATGPSPLTAAEDRQRAILEEGRTRLRALDLDPLLTDLDRGEQKLKAWNETLKQMREEMDKLSEPLRQNLLTPAGPPRPYQDLISRLAVERGIDPSLALALVGQESGFDPRARSRAGAMGLLQLMPGTAAQYGLRGGTEAERQQLQGVYEPEANLKAGLDYLASLLKQFSGDVEKALTAYNAGPGRSGIPLPSGENATFAQDVLRRIPGGFGGVYGQAVQQQQALQAAVEAQKPDPEALARIRATGREYLHGIDEEMRQAEQADRERREQTMATGREYLRALEQERQEQEHAIEQLRRLAAQYTQTKEARDEDTAATLAGKLAQTQYTEEAKLLNQAVQDSAKALEMVPALRAQARLSAAEFEGLRTLREQLEQAQETMPGGEATLFTPSRRLVQLRQRTMREVTSDEGRRQAETDLRQLERQEQLNYAANLFQQFGTSVGNAWSNALQGIASGTQTVSQAFRAMAQSIMQSLIQITSQEAWKSFLQLGVRLILGAGLGAAGAGAGAGAIGGGTSLAATGTGSGFLAGLSGASGGALAFQEGGIVRRPTFAMLGENPSMNPEVVLNRPQLESLVGGGRGSGTTPISIINVSSRAEAEQTALQQRALGRQTVINYVMEDLQKGEASQVNRAIRTLSR